MAKVGRPSILSDELAEMICERLSCGEPLAKICRDPEMPGYSTVRRWEKDNREFGALSARAKQDGTHYLADESLVIADEPLPGEDAASEIAHRKLRIDTRMRLIGKWNRQDYGEKSLIGSDPENPLPAGFIIRDIAGGGE